MPVERADADTGAARDLLQRGIDAAFGEDRRRHLDQPVAVALRIGAQRLVGTTFPPGVPGLLGGHGGWLRGQFFLHVRNIGPTRLKPAGPVSTYINGGASVYMSAPLNNSAPFII